MVIIVKCKKCNKDIEKKWFEIDVYRYGYNKPLNYKEFCLCPECYKELEKWLGEDE